MIGFDRPVARCRARGLRGEPRGRRSPGVFDFDEERARYRETGSIAHRVIGKIAASSLEPTMDEVKAEVDAEMACFSPIEARAHRQNLRGLVHQYFWHCLPPAAFMFSGAEQQLGDGRVDLAWFDVAERLLGDEVKAGNPRSLHLTATRLQVERYVATAHGIWGDRFLGFRLLSLSDPAMSLFFTPGQSPTLLTDTPYVRRP